MITYVDKSGKAQQFRNRRQLCTALWLDAVGSEWHYRDIAIPFVDMLTGKQYKHSIDFTIIDGDNITWLEAVSAAKMIPNDARIYASRRAEEAEVNYRGLTDEEIAVGEFLLGIGYRCKDVVQN